MVNVGKYTIHGWYVIYYVYKYLISSSVYHPLLSAPKISGNHKNKTHPFSSWRSASSAPNAKVHRSLKCGPSKTGDPTTNGTSQPHFDQGEGEELRIFCSGGDYIEVLTPPFGCFCWKPFVKHGKTQLATNLNWWSADFWKINSMCVCFFDGKFHLTPWNIWGRNILDIEVPMEYQEWTTLWFSRFLFQLFLFW